MRSLRNNYYCILRKISLFVLLFFIFSIPAVAVKSESFFLENYTGLDFMKGSYKIEVIELSKPGDMPFVKVNLITGGSKKLYYLRENEDPSIKDEPFNRINLNSSFISQTVAKIVVQYPDNWSPPEKYTVEKPVVNEKIPNIVLTKTVDKTTMNKGEVAEFKIIVENKGNGTAYNITLDEKLPQGFTRAAGSSFPPAIQEELKADSSLEILYALKAVESGSYVIEPTTLRHSSNTARSNSISLLVLDEKIDRSLLLTVISLDKINLFTGELVEVTVKITNNGNSSAESILIDGQTPKGMQVTKGDLRQVYKKIGAGESEEYSVVLEAVEAGNYSIKLNTIYSDDQTGFSSNSEPVIVTEKEKNYLYILIPAIIIIAGIALFVIRRHREYSF